MKTLYFECNMGAAGDMLMGALLELHPNPEMFLQKLNALKIPDVLVKAETVVKCGIHGTHVHVTVNGAEEESIDFLEKHYHEQEHKQHHHHKQEHHHEHTQQHHHHLGMQEIQHTIEQLALSEQVRKNVLAVYKLIAEAESHVHNRPVEEIHFHEVGTMDAIADIVGVCLLLEELAPEQILASSIHVGYGQVHCTHGILPVPAPATAHILQGIPIYGGTVQGELCTPTGAALLKHFVSKFVPMPVLKVSKIGYGMGKKEFEAANCVRAMLGETQDCQEEIIELCCNLDDMTPEAVSFATEQLMESGALDVFTTAVQMKKNRPGVLLTCMCHQQKRETMLKLIFKHTATIGIREKICNRYVLDRSIKAMQTKYGTLHIKQVKGWGVCREKPEYEELAEFARKNGLSLADVRKEILKP